MSDSTLPASWEYLMPKRKKRAARYVRESDPTLADSNTIDSQAQYVLDHCLKQGYECDPRHEYREALSAYTVPYMQRTKLIAMLEAAKRREFDILVVSEIRALARRQVEVFVIYDILQKYGVELETVQEKFEDSAMGRLILSRRAAFSEIEREQIYLRLQRGKKDRMEMGKAPVNGTRCYGFILVDTEKEVKARYEFNHEIIFTDKEGKQWSEHSVRKHILHLLATGMSVHCATKRLNELGIPPPRKPKKGNPSWTAETVYRIAVSPMNTGHVWGNRYKRTSTKNGKATMVERPREEWIRLPDAPSLIDEETHNFILQQIKYNKQDSLRNNKHGEDEIGLLRSGYIFCGICGHSMSLKYPSPSQLKRHKQYPFYRCQKSDGYDLIHNHQTYISMDIIDREARVRIMEALRQPELIREEVERRRAENRATSDTSDIEATIENIRHAMQNLFDLAQNATDDETIAGLTLRMKELEKAKRAAEAMLYDAEDEQQERAELEHELVRFEKWVEQVQPFLTQPSYMESAPYAELRMAVRILGLRATVYPTTGQWPYRYQIVVTVPEIMKKLHIVSRSSH